MKQFKSVISALAFLLTVQGFSSSETAGSAHKEECRRQVRRLVYLLSVGDAEERQIYYNELSGLVVRDKSSLTCETIARNRGLIELVDALGDGNEVVVSDAVAILARICTLLPSYSSALLQTSLVETLVNFIRVKREVSISLAIIQKLLEHQKNDVLGQLCKTGFLPIMRGLTQSDSEAIQSIAKTIHTMVYKEGVTLVTFVKMLSCPSVTDINHGLEGIAEFSNKHPGALSKQLKKSYFTQFFTIGGVNKEALLTIMENLHRHLDSTRGE